MKHSIERKIVANLGRRYRFAVKMKRKIVVDCLKRCDWPMTDYMLSLASEKEAEAWNAFESSRRILNGFNL